MLTRITYMKLKKIVKNSQVLSGLFYAVRRNIYSISLRRYQRKPLQNDMVLFNYFNGRGYGGNPKAIAEAFHRMYPDVRLIWTCAGDADRESLPEYIIPVKHQSPEYFRTMAIAKAWVFNVLPPGGIRKRNGQIYVQTWHGDRPLKKILKDAAEGSAKYRNTSDRLSFEDSQCDYFISGSRWFSGVWKRAAGFDGTILEYGMPRNDCLVNADSAESRERAQMVRKKYGIRNDTKVLLYAPTFRDHLLNDSTIENGPDLSGIIRHLKEKDGCEWVCLVRAHSGARLETGSDSDQYIDVTLYPDMSDILLASDLLITDYSSCAGDFALLHRPVILYQQDLDEYENKDRQLYFDMKETPFLTCADQDGFYRLLDSLNQEMICQNCDDILSFYEVVDTGKASEKVCLTIAEQAGIQ